ncbi:MAG: radical SAM protein [Proteobacteria bacterium]|nr:radical SAM protein [Pseudomonadota bacterium]MBU1715881.1 radical SAM protein [Pseudomonadota bacterium]
MPPFVIPVFIHHQGCPHRCVFCDQTRITGAAGTGRTVDAEDVRLEIERHLIRPRRFRWPVQVAFYGGSFTGLDIDLQLKLLSAVKPFIDKGEVDQIRLSTRPDYIGPDTASFLFDHGVRIVELGVQSMEPEVLAASGRGHSPDQTEAAFGYLKSGGLEVGAQLMVGLPGETTSGLIKGAYRIAGLKPDLVRIYPTVVLKGSGLARLYEDGRYRPPSLHKALALTARLKGIFDRYQIRVIRMGLQATETLEQSIVAGPYHPAFGELVLSRILFKKVRAVLSCLPAEGRGTISIAEADQSIFRGRKNMNVKRLVDLGLAARAEIIFDNNQPRNTVVVR